MATDVTNLDAERWRGDINNGGGLARSATQEQE
jgi:hypothetical protein